MKLNELEDFPELGNTIVIDGIEYVKKREPVAWCQLVDGKIQDLLTSFEMKDWLYDKSWIPLYTAPPTREPLTPQQISEGNQSMLNVTREAFKQGVIFAEKAHGIGGGDEN
jgi:hypothetical protein